MLLLVRAKVRVAAAADARAVDEGTGYEVEFRNLRSDGTVGWICGIGRVLRDAAGRLRHEECLTRDGFDGPYTLIYHQTRPHTHRLAHVAHGWIPPAAAPRPRRPSAAPW